MTMSGAFGPRDLTEQTSLLGLSIALVPCYESKEATMCVTQTVGGGQNGRKERRVP